MNWSRPQELFGREGCEWRNQLHVELWGGSLNNELDFVDKNSSEEKAVNREIQLHVGLSPEREMHLNNELESTTRTLRKRKLCNREILLHVGLWGGKFKQ